MDEAQLIHNWTVVSLLIGLNHGVEDLLFAYTTIVYAGRLGFYCNSIVYLLWLVGSFTVASPFTAKVGARASILLGLVLFDCQYVAFLLCIVLREGSQLQTGIALTGAVCSGFGASFLWTGEGVYFSQTASLLANITGEDVEHKTTSMAAIFGFWSLFLEAVIKLVTYGVDQYGMPIFWTFSCSLLLAVLATVGVAALSQNLPRHQGVSPKREVLFGVVRLWADPRIWLISFLTFSFSVSGAFLNGVIAPLYVKPQLGTRYVALFSAAGTLAGMAVQGPYRFLADWAGKGYVQAIGSCSMILVPILAYTVDMSRFGVGLICFYLLQGLVRGDIEAVNRAIYADHFPGSKTEPAFANLCMQSGLSAAAAFFFEPVLPQPVMALATAFFGLLVVPGYILANRSLRSEQFSCASP